jgi:hypothetical protein
MENTYKNRITEEANAPAHYKLIVVGVVIGMIGILLRFTGSWTLINVVSNIIFVIGIVICLKAVLTILK